MSQTSTKPPSGMRDFLAPDVVRRRHVTSIVQRVYESFGFVPLETPTIENLSSLLGKYGPEGDQLLYRILHRREKLLRALVGTPREEDLADEGLRYDLTVPLARVVANYRELPAFYKRYAIQPVWRADRPAKGRFREFWQCDVDITGTRSLVADAEVCGAVAEALHQLGFQDFKILTNHRQLLRALVALAGIPEQSEALALIVLDKLDKVGVDAVKQELAQKGVALDRTEALLALLEQSRQPGALARLASGEGALAAGARELQQLFAHASKGPAASHLVFDPSLARGLGYYTGPIFEVSCAGLAGSMGGGGRYDNLIGMWKQQQVPAVGFSLGLERVLLVMEERGMFPPLAIGPQILLCRMADVEASVAIGVATALRAQGLRVEIHADAPQLGKQLQYANAIGAPFAAILGSSEVAAGTVTLKDLTSGTQAAVQVAEVASRLSRPS
ncbi:MAG TPA: histidine--tRNA ligase [Planctomycetota bacterium]